jgi:hypothetical protein
MTGARLLAAAVAALNTRRRRRPVPRCLPPGLFGRGPPTATQLPPIVDLLRNNHHRSRF